MIDIIIPCHNSHETLPRCLGSILMQTELKQCKITLVNDGGESNRDIVKHFEPYMNIREIGYADNHGPGYARNFGIDNTYGEYIMFIDSDDALANPFSVKILSTELANPDIVMCSSEFMEQVGYDQMKKHVHDTSFMHGKMYKRSFLDKYKIRQNTNCVANEDVGFNILAMLARDRLTEKVAFLQIVTYFWMYNPSSIVRNNQQYYNTVTSTIEFARNLVYVYEELKRIGKDSPAIFTEKVASMMRLYKTFNEKTYAEPEYLNTLAPSIQDFYTKIYVEVEANVSEQMLIDVYATIKDSIDFNAGYFKEKTDDYVLQDFKDFLKWIKEWKHE